MKINIILFLVFLVGVLNAQVGIERDDQTEIVRGDGLLDFASPATKGVLLPKVTNANLVESTGEVGGAMMFNIDTQRVEFYNPATTNWEPMTEASYNVISGYELNEKDGKGAIIEDDHYSGDTPTGILVLNSDQKALILPQVNDIRELPSPKAGTICYDMSRKSIAVYNGTVWSFWN